MMHFRLLKLVGALLILGVIGVTVSTYVFKQKFSFADLGSSALSVVDKFKGILNDSGEFKYGDYITVTRVIDGDTVLLENGEKLRYIGINAPELSKTETIECFALEATTENQRLVEGKEIRIEKDVSEKDKYGRLLGYAYLKDGTFINMELVKNGFALATPYAPDISKQNLFKELEKEAEYSKWGLWKSCK